MEKFGQRHRRVTAIFAVTAERLAPPALIFASLAVTGWLVSLIVGI